jgi:hypothetical protein
LRADYTNDPVLGVHAEATFGAIPEVPYAGVFSGTFTERVV